MMSLFDRFNIDQKKEKVQYDRCIKIYSLDFNESNRKYVHVRMYCTRLLSQPIRYLFFAVVHYLHLRNNLCPSIDFVYCKKNRLFIVRTCAILFHVLQ
jgi:hypothetical protein